MVYKHGILKDMLLRAFFSVCFFVCLFVFCIFSTCSTVYCVFAFVMGYTLMCFLINVIYYHLILSYVGENKK